MDLKYSIVIPVYNSEKSLERLVGEIQSYFSACNESYEIVLVDDFSQDNSWQVIEMICRKNSNIHGLKMDRNVGQQMALYEGLRHSRGTYAVTMDDDLQHDIRELDGFIEKAKSGCDLIFGIYDSYGPNDVRLWGSKLIGAFFKTHFKNLRGNRVSSFRMIHESVYKSLPKIGGDFVYLSASLLPYAQKVANVSVKRRERVYGTSGYTLLKCMKIAFKLYIYYGGFPWKLLRGVRSGETGSNGWSGELPGKWH
jgi:glycosyltransferase involved in cell wall biosynthesis